MTNKQSTIFVASRMREGTTVEDYRGAIDGQGAPGSLGHEWRSRPHVLLHELCNEIDRLNVEIERLKSQEPR